MALELDCTIVRKLAVQNGTSARGQWTKQEFIVEYKDGNFPNQVCMNVWGQDKVADLDRFNAGDAVKISFNLSSREFNGRWYTDIRAWRIEPAGGAQASAPAPQAATYGGTQAPAAGPAAANGQGAQAPRQPYQGSVPAGFAPTAPAPTMDDMPGEPLDADDLPF